MKRLESLDILRGMDMFMILSAGWCPLIYLCEALGSPSWGEPGCWWFINQCHHARWGAGVTIIDFIFPLFTFIAGVSFPYSWAKHPDWWRLPKRAAMLFVLGCVYNHVFAFDWEHFTCWSVIGRIGIAWAIAAAVFALGGRKAAWGTIAAVLVAWAAVFLLQTDPRTMKKTIPVFGLFCSFAMTANALAGMLLGDYLRTSGHSGGRKTLTMIVSGVASTALGLAWAYLPGVGIPVNKIVWSSPYILVTVGASLLALALVYWIVDVRGWTRWGFFFKVIGVNPLTIYLLSWTVLRWERVKEFFFSGCLAVWPGPVMNFIAEWGTLAFFWLLIYYMYRKNIFLRV